MYFEIKYPSNPFSGWFLKTCTEIVDIPKILHKIASNDMTKFIKGYSSFA
jgi:hypothetical protein